MVSIENTQAASYHYPRHVFSSIIDLWPSCTDCPYSGSGVACSAGFAAVGAGVALDVAGSGLVNMEEWTGRCIEREARGY